MGFIKWLFGYKEEISARTMKHSTLGDYTQNSNRLTNGGHSQKAIDYMNKNGIKYKINKTYSNGVRTGYVEEHKSQRKKAGNNQAWFPKWWSDATVKRAAQTVSRGKIMPDGITKVGYYGDVKVGVIRTKGKIATIFPMNIQTNKKGKELRWK